MMKHKTRIIFAAMLGNLVEAFDMAICGLLSVYFAKFFYMGDATKGLLIVFATFFVSAFFSVFALAVLAGFTAAVLTGAFVETFAAGGTVAAELASAVFVAELASTFEFVLTTGTSVEASGLELKTETPPFRAGIANIRADESLHRDVNHAFADLPSGSHNPFGPGH